MAESMESIDAVKELLKCPICFNLFSDPKTLPCEHSFCAQCLADTVRAKIIKKDGEVVLHEQALLPLVCPICNAEYRNFQSISSVKTSLLLKQMLDTVSKKQDSARKTEKCVACERPGLLVCIQCDVFVCKRCHDGGHTVSLPGKTCKGVGHYVLEKRDDDFCCKLHHITADLFCTKCERIICLDCFFTEHKDHKTKTVKSAREDVKFLSAKCKSIVEGNSRSLKELKVLKDNRMLNMKHTTAAALRQLKTTQLQFLSVLCKHLDNQTAIAIAALRSHEAQFAGPAGWNEPNDRSSTFLEMNTFVNSKETSDLKAVAELERMKTSLKENEKEMKEIEDMITWFKTTPLPPLHLVEDYFNIQSFISSLQSDDFLQPSKIPKSQDLLREIKESQIMKDIFFNDAAPGNCKDNVLETAISGTPSQTKEFMQRKTGLKEKEVKHKEQERPDSSEGCHGACASANTETCRKFWVVIEHFANTTTEQKLKRNIEEFTGPDSVDVVLISAQWQSAVVIFSSQDDLNVLRQSGISFDGKRPYIWMPRQDIQEFLNSLGWRNISGGKVIYITNFGDRTSAKELQGVLEQHTGITSVEKVFYREGNYYAHVLLKDSKAVKKMVRRSISLNGKKLKIFDFAKDWMPGWILGMKMKLRPYYLSKLS